MVNARYLSQALPELNQFLEEDRKALKLMLEDPEASPATVEQTKLNIQLYERCIAELKMEALVNTDPTTLRVQ